MCRRASRRARTRRSSSRNAESNSDLLLAFFNDQLAHEYDRRASLDSRAQSIVSVSTAITSASAAVAALAGGDLATLATPLRWLLLIAAAGFVLAAVGGLVAYWPRGTRAASMKTLEDFHDTVVRAQARQKTSAVLARYVLVELGPLREGNRVKGTVVRIAGCLQIVAIAALAAALTLSVI